MRIGKTTGKCGFAEDKGNGANNEQRFSSGGDFAPHRIFGHV